MKRIPNKISLGNVTAGIIGTQKIKVLDYDNSYDLCMDIEQKATVIYEGTNAGFIGYQYSMYHESEYHGMRLEKDTLIFKLFTKVESYK